MKKNKNCNFATYWFHTLVMPCMHAEGPATFISIRKQQVSLYKAQSTRICFHREINVNTHV